MLTSAGTAAAAAIMRSTLRRPTAGSGVVVIGRLLGISVTCLKTGRAGRVHAGAVVAAEGPPRGDEHWRVLGRLLAWAAIPRAAAPLVKSLRREEAADVRYPLPCATRFRSLLRRS
ncbi:hypothetical protein GCM10027271_35950 [Saccharopolyspora gloriosae]